MRHDLDLVYLYIDMVGPCRAGRSRRHADATPPMHGARCRAGGAHRGQRRAAGDFSGGAHMGTLRRWGSRHRRAGRPTATPPRPPVAPPVGDATTWHAEPTMRGLTDDGRRVLLALRTSSVSAGECAGRRPWGPAVSPHRRFIRITLHHPCLTRGALAGARLPQVGLPALRRLLRSPSCSRCDERFALHERDDATRRSV